VSCTDERSFLAAWNEDLGYKAALRSPYITVEVVRALRSPHCKQNFDCGGFSCSQRGHCIAR
jgi:hypothetical protein